MRSRATRRARRLISRRCRLRALRCSGPAQSTLPRLQRRVSRGGAQPFGVRDIRTSLGGAVAVNEVHPKEQPTGAVCPRCGDAIVWQVCAQCGGLGVWRFVASSHCGAPQQGRYCSECGVALPAWVEDCAFCGGRGWLAGDHPCRSASAPPPGRPFRVDPESRPQAVDAARPSASVSAPATSPTAASAEPAPASAVREPAAAPSSRPDPAPAPVEPAPAPVEPASAPAEPARKDRMNLWVVILFLIIFAVLIASPELSDTIRRSVMGVFGR